jgi:hypothetical protein
MAGKTLDELESVVWGVPKFDSHLVTECYRLRTKPIDDFTVEDLRIMIGQKIGLQHQMPRAIDALEREPLAEGHYYPGDLLANAIECGEWLRLHSSLMQRLVVIAERALVQLGKEDDDLSGRLNAFVASNSGRCTNMTGTSGGGDAI